MSVIVECPHCGAQVNWSEAATWRPFCSERCKMVDLGAWFSEEHVIPGKSDAPGEQWDEDGALSSFSPNDPSTQQ